VETGSRQENASNQIRILEPRFDSIETRLKGNKKAGAIISHRLCLIC